VWIESPGFETYLSAISRWVPGRNCSYELSACRFPRLTPP
jgi:hypothetical protein